MMDEWFVPEKLTMAELEIAGRHVRFNSLNNNVFFEFKDEIERSERQIIRNEAFFKSLCSEEEYEYWCKKYGKDESIW